MADNKAARNAARDVQKELMKTAAGRAKLLTASQFTLPPDMRDLPVEQIPVDANVAITESLTKTMDVIYGSRLAACVKNSLEGGDIRNLIERAGPQQQCNAVVGELVSGTTACWICKQTIGGDAYVQPKGPREECEHKFGVLQSIFFTGLYDSKVKSILPPAKKQQYLDLLVKEYAWSHRRCNQIKRAASLVTFKKEGGNLVWIPNVEKTREMMNSIVKGKDSPDLIPTTAELQKMGIDIEERTSRIANSHVQRILNVANKIDTRQLLSGAVLSLRFRANLLYPECYQKYPPPLAVQAPRGGGKAEYDRANQLLEHVIRYNSAEKLLKSELDSEDVDVVGGKAVSGEEAAEEGSIDAITEILAKYEQVLEKKLAMDEALSSRITDEQFEQLYDLADRKASEKEMIDWIFATIVNPVPGAPKKRPNPFAGPLAKRVATEYSSESEAPMTDAEPLTQAYGGRRSTKKGGKKRRRTIRKKKGSRSKKQ